jgi:hypothetical protein
MSGLFLILALAGAPGTTLAPAAPAPAVQSANRSVPVGDPQRRLLLDVIRPAVQADIGQPVQFVVDTLRTRGDWAFYAGRIQQPTGRPINFARTPYADRLDEGSFDGPATYAVLRRVNGNWRLVEFVVGPTDVAYLGWPEAHGAPMALFE